jgi:hypothetical protein
MSRSLLLLLTAACTASPGAWVATDGMVAIAVIDDGERTLGYMCGATEDNVGTHTSWFDDAGDSPSGEWTLSFEPDGGALAITVSGVEELTLTATPATDPLYEYDGHCRMGAILTDDLAVGRWCDIDGLSYQVEPLEFTAGAPEATLRPVGIEAEAFTARLSKP